MSLKILADRCVQCDACVGECPNEAISVRRGVYTVDPAKCTECRGRFAEPQCAAVCPADCCVREG